MNNKELKKAYGVYRRYHGFVNADWTNSSDAFRYFVNSEISRMSQEIYSEFSEPKWLCLFNMRDDYMHARDKYERGGWVMRQAIKKGWNKNGEAWLKVEEKREFILSRQTGYIPF